MECPVCEGNGEIVDDVIDGRIEITYPCGFCRKKGVVNIFQWIYWKWLTKDADK